MVRCLKFPDRPSIPLEARSRRWRYRIVTNGVTWKAVCRPRWWPFWLAYTVPLATPQEVWEIVQQAIEGERREKGPWR